MIFMIIYLLYILLVDDDRDTLRLIQKYLESKGARVNAYSDALVALQSFVKNKEGNNYYYDLVISNIRIHQMNGIELVANIRKMNKDIPIILMSDPYSDIMANLDPSFLKFLHIENIINKPVKLKELLEKINTMKHKVIV